MYVKQLEKEQQVQLTLANNNPLEAIIDIQDVFCSDENGQPIQDETVCTFLVGEALLTLLSQYVQKCNKNKHQQPKLSLGVDQHGRSNVYHFEFDAAKLTKEPTRKTKTSKGVQLKETIEGGSIKYQIEFIGNDRVDSDSNAALNFIYGFDSPYSDESSYSDYADDGDSTVVLERNIALTRRDKIELKAFKVQSGGSPLMAMKLYQYTRELYLDEAEQVLEKRKRELDAEITRLDKKIQELKGKKSLLGKFHWLIISLVLNPESKLVVKQNKMAALCVVEKNIEEYKNPQGTETFKTFTLDAALQASHGNAKKGFFPKTWAALSKLHQLLTSLERAVTGRPDTLFMRRFSEQKRKNQKPEQSIKSKEPGQSQSGKRDVRRVDKSGRPVCGRGTQRVA